MTSQHSKWLKIVGDLPWREDIASLNYILTSYVWQQDHNGYTHQEPGFLNHLATKKPDIARIYLPADTNTLLCTMHHCLGTKNRINAIVASKHPRTQFLSMEQAQKHFKQGISIWNFASNDQEHDPDLVIACAGVEPTLEALAAVSILREYLPKLKIRFINVVDLFKLQSDKRHPHGLSDADYDAIFTKDKPIVFNFHGYPDLIHQLTYDRENQNLHVHGYIEEGTITTSFDMKVQNRIDRYHIVLDALKYLPQLGNRTSSLIEECKNKLIEHKIYIANNGKDTDEICNWTWKKY
jgi:xylulose-5-phosphate/fructose-6-phosphate phosphoketolase